MEWEGFQDLELPMVGTPASQLVDLISARVHEASELAPPFSGAPSPSVEASGLYPLWALPQGEPVMPSLPQHQWP